MQTIMPIEYNGETLYTISDERGLFTADTGTMKAIANDLIYSASILDDEYLTHMDKEEILKQEPEMYPQIYGEDELWREYKEKNKPKSYPKKEKDTSGYVYLIKATGHNYYKIGVSANIPSRVKNLERQYPFEIEIIHTFYSENAYGKEKHLHNIFKNKRCKGEWFELNDVDVQHITNWNGKDDSIFI